MGSSKDGDGVEALTCDSEHGGMIGIEHTWFRISAGIININAFIDEAGTTFETFTGLLHGDSKHGVIGIQVCIEHAMFQDI